MPLYKKLDINQESTINEPLLETTIEKATGGNVRTTGTRLVQKNIVVITNFFHTDKIFSVFC